MDGLHQRQMNVARTRRKIDQKIVEFAPLGIANELFQGVASHSATPNKCRTRVDKKANRQNFYTIFLNRHNQRAPINLVGHGTRILNIEHFGNGRTENISIEQTHTVAHLCQRHCQICRHSRLSHAAFSRRNGDDVFHAFERLFLFRSGLLATFYSDVSINLNLGRDISFDGLFACLHERARKRVVLFFEQKRKAHFLSVDAHIVLYHAARHNVFARSRVAHMRQGVENQFGVQSHS